jgi:hypothetical protein
MERYVEGRERVWMKTNCMESRIHRLFKLLNVMELCKNTPKRSKLQAEFPP